MNISFVKTNVFGLLDHFQVGWSRWYSRPKTFVFPKLKFIVLALYF